MDRVECECGAVLTDATEKGLIEKVKQQSKEVHSADMSDEQARELMASQTKQ
jgi:hypothetical protein